MLSMCFMEGETGPLVLIRALITGAQLVIQTMHLTWFLLGLYFMLDCHSLLPLIRI